MKVNGEKFGRLFGWMMGIVLILAVMGCEPPSDEDMQAYWEADGTSDASIELSEPEYEGETGWVTSNKADSASKNKNNGKNTKSVSIYDTKRRPLIGNEAIGHGTPQPWKPADPNSESSEEEN